MVSVLVVTYYAVYAPFPRECTSIRVTAHLLGLHVPATVPILLPLNDHYFIKNKETCHVWKRAAGGGKTPIDVASDFQLLAATTHHLPLTTHHLPL